MYMCLSNITDMLSMQQEDTIYIVGQISDKCREKLHGLENPIPPTRSLGVQLAHFLTQQQHS